MGRISSRKGEPRTTGIVMINRPEPVDGNRGRFSQFKLVLVDTPDISTEMSMRDYELCKRNNEDKRKCKGVDKSRNQIVKQTGCASACWPVFERCRNVSTSTSFSAEKGIVSYRL